MAVRFLERQLALRAFRQSRYGRVDELPEERVRPVRAAPELGMELDADDRTGGPPAP